MYSFIFLGLIISCFRLPDILPNIIQGVLKDVNYTSSPLLPTSSHTRALESYTLLIYIHGLNGSPTHVAHHLSQLQENEKLKNNSILIYTPVIDKYVHGSIGEIVEQIHTGVAHLIKDAKEIIIIGNSMGGLVAKKMKDLYCPDAFAIYIATPFYGTRFFEFVPSLLMTNYLLNVSNALELYSDDFRMNSKPFSNDLCVASKMDDRVIPFQRALPPECTKTMLFQQDSHFTLQHTVIGMFVIGELSDIQQKKKTTN